MKMAEVLRIFRKVNNYSGQEVAERMGVQVAYVSRVERILDQQITLETLQKFAAAFNVGAYEILKIYELSEKENWNFQKTMFEVVKIYLVEK